MPGKGCGPKKGRQGTGASRAGSQDSESIYCQKGAQVRPRQGAHTILTAFSSEYLEKNTQKMHKGTGRALAWVECSGHPKPVVTREFSAWAPHALLLDFTLLKSFCFYTQEDKAQNKRGTCHPFVSPAHLCPSSHSRSQVN